MLSFKHPRGKALQTQDIWFYKRRDHKEKTFIKPLLFVLPRELIVFLSVHVFVLNGKSFIVVSIFQVFGI